MSSGDHSPLHPTPRLDQVVDRMINCRDIVFDPAERSMDVAGAVFFISFVIVANWTLLQVVVAVLLENFLSATELARKKRHDKSMIEAGHAVLRHPLDPLLSSLSLFDTPEDLASRISELFKILDGDGSKRLSFEEMREGLLRLRVYPAIALTEEDFERITLERRLCNDDGEVDEMGFQAMMISEFNLYVQRQVSNSLKVVERNDPGQAGSILLVLKLLNLSGRMKSSEQLLSASPAAKGRGSRADWFSASILEPRRASQNEQIQLKRPSELAVTASPKLEPRGADTLGGSSQRESCRRLPLLSDLVPPAEDQSRSSFHADTSPSQAAAAAAAAISASSGALASTSLPVWAGALEKAWTGQLEAAERGHQRLLAEVTEGRDRVIQRLEEENHRLRFDLDAAQVVITSLAGVLQRMDLSGIICGGSIGTRTTSSASAHSPALHASQPSKRQPQQPQNSRAGGEGLAWMLSPTSLSADPETRVSAGPTRNGGSAESAEALVSAEPSIHSGAETDSRFCAKQSNGELTPFSGKSAGVLNGFRCPPPLPLPPAGVLPRGRLADRRAADESAEERSGPAVENFAGTDINLEHDGLEVHIVPGPAAAWTSGADGPGGDGSNEEKSGTRRIGSPRSVVRAPSAQASGPAAVRKLEPPPMEATSPNLEDSSSNCRPLPAGFKFLQTASDTGVGNGSREREIEGNGDRVGCEGGWTRTMGNLKGGEDHGGGNSGVTMGGGGGGDGSGMMPMVGWSTVTELS
mmetsp:Transcript_4525/g.13630  ORF Transcript_4525/g.13630 Transcript_4525/m.13630 type:complete len:752 (-) Transcript_4525:505-2760(-)